MNTETKTRPSIKLAFWLAVMLFCDYGLYQVGHTIYLAVHQ